MHTVCIHRFYSDILIKYKMAAHCVQKPGERDQLIPGFKELECKECLHSYIYELV